MTNLDFDNPKNREQSIANFISLLNHPGWILVEEIANANIQLLTKQIIDGTGDNETKETIDMLRNKLNAYKDVVNTPRKMIDRLKPTDVIIGDDNDPYTTVQLENKDKK